MEWLVHCNIATNDSKMTSCIICLKLSLHDGFPDYTKVGQGRYSSEHMQVSSSTLHLSPRTPTTKNIQNMVASFGIAVTAFLLTLQPALALFPDVSSNNIFARQLGGLDAGNIPTSCLTGSSCAALASAVSGSSCTTLKCLCTATIANGLKSCIQCAVTAGASGYTQAQADSAIDEFVSGCSAGGFPITGFSSSGGSTVSSSGGLGSSATATGSKASVATNTNTNTAVGGGANTATAVTPTNTGTTSQPLPGLNSASKTSVGSLGVIVVLAVIALL